MTTEQKAKAYDKAINAIKELKAKHPTAHVIKDWIKDNFPELTESKDERIRKIIKQSLKSYFDGKLSIGTNDVDYAMCLSWLKKQGEQKKSYDTCDSSMMDNKKSPYGEKRDFGYFEEKPADKIEPMFKVGEWIITPNNQIKQIKFITLGNYHFTDGSLYNMIDVDNKGHLWTIQYANDGDVLVSNDASYIVLFKGLSFLEDGIDRFKSYCHYREGIFSPIEYTSWCCNVFHPATKEQRDILMKSMANAGYTFDFEKKELKKIEDKPAWSEEDEKILNKIIQDYEAASKSFCGYQGKLEWLKSLKDRVQLQNRWKPSEEQLKSLQKVIDAGYFTSYPNSLETLYEQLKQL